MGTTDVLSDQTKVKCLKFSIPDFSSQSIIVPCTSNDFMDFWNEIDCGEIGDKFQIEIVELMQCELDELPEFEGW